MNVTINDLTEWEIQLLRECNGEILPSPWGAAVGAGLEFLAKSGYITIQGRITDKGREALKTINNLREA